MKLDRVYSDVKEAIKHLLRALDNNITVQENFGPSGAAEGQTIVSRGPARTPVWGDAPATQITAIDGSTVHSGTSVIIIAGPPGPPGSPGAEGPAGAEFEGHYEPMAFDCEVYFNSECDVVMGWFNP